MDILEKVAYIKGLAEGLELDTSTKEGKILNAIIDLLDDMATEIYDIEEGCSALVDQIDAVDEDLSSVEELLYGDDDCDCDCCDDEDELYEIECPSCHDIIYLDEEMLEEDGIDCPNCKTKLEFEFDCDPEDSGCDCGCANEE